MSTPLPSNFLNKTRKTDCLIWIGSTNRYGYGQLVVDGQQMLAHRVAYAAEYGPIPDGMVIDHICRVRNCVNPAHLELVTHSINTRRGYEARALRVGDCCINGHTIGYERDLFRRLNGTVECRACGRERSQGRGKTVQKTVRGINAALDQIDGPAA